MKNTSLNDLYIEELRDLYSAENQLVVALPKMVKAASEPSLASAFEEHLGVTREHVKRLERIFRDLEANPKGKHCKAMEGLIEEGGDAIKSANPSPVRDAALIAAAQRVEHYEMAGYGCVRTFARMLGHEEAATLLQQTLDEEATADENLSTLAESVINLEAINPAMAGSRGSGSREEEEEE